MSMNGKFGYIDLTTNLICSIFKMKYIS